MSLETTYQIFLKSKYSEAADVLARGVESGSPSTRDRCIVTLARRCDAYSFHVMTQLWPKHRAAIVAALDSHKGEALPFFGRTIDQLEAKRSSPEKVQLAVELAVVFDLISGLPQLIDIAQNHESRQVRECAIEPLLLLCQQWGSRARRGYPGERPSTTLERQRLEAMALLYHAVEDFQTHRNQGLLDAFLALGTWNDPSIQSVFKQESPSQNLLLRRLRSSENVGVLEILAGFVRRKSIPCVMTRIAWQRDDRKYREILLSTITASPNNTTLDNIREFGLPDCLRGGVTLLDDVGADRDAAIANVYSAAMPKSPETLSVLLEIVDRHGPESPLRQEAVEAVAHAFDRVEPPSTDVWLHAMCSSVMDGVAYPPVKSMDLQSDLAAKVCTGLVELSLSEGDTLSGHAQRLLSELSIHRTLPLFHKLSLPQRLRLGRTLMLIDAGTLGVISDGLRHAVMERRLQAIEFAQTLGLVDLLIDPLAQIVREDHQTARIATTVALGQAKGEASLSLLHELSESQSGSIRDAARTSLEVRGIRE